MPPHPGTADYRCCHRRVKEEGNRKKARRSKAQGRGRMDGGGALGWSTWRPRSKTAGRHSEEPPRPGRGNPANTGYPRLRSRSRRCPCAAFSHPFGADRGQSFQVVAGRCESFQSSGLPSPSHDSSSDPTTQVRISHLRFAGYTKSCGLEPRDSAEQAVRGRGPRAEAYRRGRPSPARGDHRDARNGVQPRRDPLAAAARGEGLGSRFRRRLSLCDTMMSPYTNRMI